MALSDKKCVPCEGGIPKLQGKEIEGYSHQIQDWWEVLDDKKIRREITFPDFKSAMAFANKVAVIAEAEQHHPDLHISYGKVIIELWTHAINGLSENDFILAAKIDDLK